MSEEERLFNTLQERFAGLTREVDRMEARRIEILDENDDISWEEYNGLISEIKRIALERIKITDEMSECLIQSSGFSQPQ